MEKINAFLVNNDSGAAPPGAPCAVTPLPALSHFDELRGTAGRAAGTEPVSPQMAEGWDKFFKELGPDGFGDLNRRMASLRRQVRDNGVTYNVYADTSGPQRPWSLDLFPLIVTPQSWQQIELGVLQRVRLLDRVMADVYGTQTLLAKGLLPSALVQGQPGYLRPMHGVAPVGGTYLHIVAFDLARGSDGNWWVVAQRTQAPSGLGYLLENRLCVSRQFPQAFESMQVQRLAGTYRTLVDSLKAMSPAGANAHVALLTPGPFNETYFEHAYLARYLGLSLVEGGDLLVRDQRVYLKTLQGLQPVHCLLKRLDDEFLDPLELRSDSTLGVPGLLQAIRAGNVLVANAPGSGFLESPALLGFLPALSRHLLGETLQLPSLATWWCGERAAMQDALPHLADCVVKPTYPGSQRHASFDAALGQTLSRRELDEWAGRIMRQSDEHTLQQYLPLSQMPTWSQVDGQDRIVPRSAILRIFAVCDGPQSWRVLPGGMARISASGTDIASMQRGGSSADVWVLAPGQVDSTTLAPTAPGAAPAAHRKWPVTSRSAENLFWMGRYTERAENTVRLARLTLESLNGDAQSSAPLLLWLTEMATSNGLVLPDVPTAAHARRVFERSLIDALDKTELVSSVGYNLQSLKSAAFTVRERMSQEHWNLVVRAESDFFRRCRQCASEGNYSASDAMRVLDEASGYLAAMTGAQTDRMTRDDGWRLLSIGRNLERLAFFSSALSFGFETGAVHDEGGFDAIVALFDSTITFHANYQQSHDIAALLDLLVIDRDNPRALAWVAQTLRRRLAKLAGSAGSAQESLALCVPDPDMWHTGALLDSDTAASGTAKPAAPVASGRSASAEYIALLALLDHCAEATQEVSNRIASDYFTHSLDTKHSVGA